MLHKFVILPCSLNTLNAWMFSLKFFSKMRVKEQFSLNSNEIMVLTFLKSNELLNFFVFLSIALMIYCLLLSCAETKVNT